MIFFLSLIGDFESLLNFQTVPPEPICPSINPRSIILFLRYKRWRKGSLVTDLSGSVVKDVEGKDVKCGGGWNSPDNHKQFIMALGCLVKARGQNSPYEEPCKYCVKIYEELGEKTGCDHHRDGMLFRRGDPTKHQDVINEMKKVDKSCATYKSNGDCPITPWDLMKIRSVLMSTGSLQDLQMYVMILIGIRLFLRSAELVDLKISMVDGSKKNLLNWKTSVFTPEGELTGLTFDIMGKKDPKPVSLVLWRDEVVPEFCPLRHLLAYIFIWRKLKVVICFHQQEHMG